MLRPPQEPLACCLQPSSNLTPRLGMHRRCTRSSMRSKRVLTRCFRKPQTCTEQSSHTAMRRHRKPPLTGTLQMRPLRPEGQPLLCMGYLVQGKWQQRISLRRWTAAALAWPAPSTKCQHQSRQCSLRCAACRCLPAPERAMTSHSCGV